VFAYYVVYIYFFFFSSRRRHTRFSRDWSSDVCSSDLDWISDKWGAVMDFFRSVPGKLKEFFGRVKDFITAPFRTAFNFVADAWKIGRASCRERGQTSVDAVSCT